MTYPYPEKKNSLADYEYFLIVVEFCKVKKIFFETQTRSYIMYTYIINNMYLVSHHFNKSDSVNELYNLEEKKIFFMLIESKWKQE